MYDNKFHHVDQEQDQIVKIKSGSASGGKCHGHKICRRQCPDKFREQAHLLFQSGYRRLKRRQAQGDEQHIDHI